MSSAFMFGVQRIQALSTNTFFIACNGADTAAPNAITTFHLPSSAIIDTKRLLLHFDATTANSTGADGRGRLPPVQYLIERVTVSAGGVQITNGNSYHNACLAVKQALSKNKIDSASGHRDFARAIKPVDGQALGADENETYAAGSRLFAINLLEHLELQPQYLDTSLLGTVEVTIQWASNAVISTVASRLLPGAQTGADPPALEAARFDVDGAGARYECSHMRLSVPVVAFAGSFYDEMVSSRMQSAGFVEYAFKNTFVHQSRHTTSTRVSVSTQSLDRIYTAFRSTTAATQGAPVPVTGGVVAMSQGMAVQANATAANLLTGSSKQLFPNSEERYTPKLFTFAAPAANTTYQVNVNGVNMPQAPVTNSEAYAITRQNLMGSTYYCPEKMHLSQYTTNYFVTCLARLNLSDGEYERIISGLDTRGSSADITITTQNSPERDLLVLLECQSTLRVGQAKAIEVVV